MLLKWAAVLTALVAGTSAAIPASIFIDAVPTAKEAAAQFTGAKHEPFQGCLLGAYVDLDESITDIYTDRTGIQRRLPNQFEKLTGRQHASYFFYLGYGRPAPVDWITYLGMSGRVVHIALEPNNGFEYVLENLYLRRLAQSLADTRTPILLRFASEMNGDWVPWHGSPRKYIEKFRMVAKVMKEHAPNVAMVWCPYATPLRPIPEYYPGDDVVDWVGVNMYNVTFFNQNPRTPGSQVGPTEMLDPIYRMYAARKPIIIAEYGVTHFSALENRKDPRFAQGCLKALYMSLPRKYPRVKMITYFNTNNLKLAHRQNNNYAVTDHPEVLKTYRSLISDSWFRESYTEGDRRLTTQPLPLKSGRVVEGVIRLSGWAPIHKGVVRLRLRANGKVIHEAPDVSSWRVNLDTTEYPNGPLRLTAEVVAKGRVTSRENVTVTVSN
jgi:hypothetical protein